METLHRKTTRRVELPDDLGEPVSSQYTDGDFRPNRVTETLEEDARGWSYVVHMEGPKVTKAGKDHSTHRGNRTFGATSGRGIRLYGDTADMPDWLKPYLVGPDGLRDATVSPVPGGEG